MKLNFWISISLLLLSGNLALSQITLTNGQIGIILSNKLNGSGFTFRKNNLVFTAAHVVTGADSIMYCTVYVRGDKHLAPNLPNMKIVKIDLDYDYAILKYKDSISPQVFSPPSKFNLQLNQLIYYIGFDTVETMKTGNPSMQVAASRITKIDSIIVNKKVIKYFEFLGEGVPGYSGGPILNEKNQVIGFMKAYRRGINNEIIDIGYSILPANKYFMKK